MWSGRLAGRLARLLPEGAGLVRGAATGALRLADRVMPTNAEIEAYLGERRPDVVLFTPYVGLRSIQPDFLRAAQALGLRTAVCVKSWDNLSSKSLIRPVPDRVFVWNEIQRKEATTLHSIPADRVVQIHLAGHTHKGTHILDTHSAHVVDSVWELYREAYRRMGGVSTLLEWDADIPEFDVVHAEALKARHYRESPQPALPEFEAEMAYGD